ncbi:MAG: anti-sigma factor [Bacteroidota bacterium]
MDKETFLKSGLIEQYVLGIASEEEAKLVEQFADQHPVIQQEIDSLREGLEQYAKQYAIDPPDGLKGRIMEEIDGLDQAASNMVAQQLSNSQTQRTRSNFWALITSAAALIGLALAFSFYQQRNNAQDQLAAAQAELAMVQEQCSKDKAAFQQTQQTLAFLNSKQTLPVNLKGSTLAPEAVAVVYWNSQEKKALFNGLNLPELPADKTYQIWADVEGEMINMGVLDRTNPNLQEVAFIDHAESLNITVEPKGGSEHPTVELLYLNGYI